LRERLHVAQAVEAVPDVFVQRMAAPTRADCDVEEARVARAQQCHVRRVVEPACMLCLALVVRAVRGAQVGEYAASDEIVGGGAAEYVEPPYTPTHVGGIHTVVISIVV